MLTKEHAIAEYDFARGRLVPDRLTRRKHAHYLTYARRMLKVYRSGIGETRRELHRGVQRVFAHEEDCPTRRIDAFCKLLDDASTYQRDRQGQAATLRRQVFQLAAPRHPLVRQPDRLFESSEDTVKGDIARQLARTWEDIDRELFADVIEFHRLIEFSGYPSPEALLARYNVAQFQAALFQAVRMAVWARGDFKSILRYAKLARLMHTITRQADGQYRLQLDGPASVLRETRRYGAAMARFLPGLLSCRDWRMHATVKTRRAGWELSLDLAADDGLQSHVAEPPEFDSALEQSFADKWGEKPRDGWRLLREGEILHHGQKVFVPDFSFQHEDGRKVPMEIVGFWTPEYLQAKVATLKAFRHVSMLLAVCEYSKHKMPVLGMDVIVYKSALHVKDVLEHLSRVQPVDETGEE